MKKSIYTKSALLLSVCLLLLWSLLGAGSSLAWFADTSPVNRNVFRFGELDAAVLYKTEGDTYETVTAQTVLFDETALYEPGYVQVVYLKIQNQGTVPFRCRLAVTVRGVTVGETAEGQPIYLPDHLRFGAVFGDFEGDLSRVAAETVATIPLGDWTQADTVTVPAGGERYAAVVVCMPKTVGNEANYRGTAAPAVELGVTVTAEQT